MKYIVPIFLLVLIVGILFTTRYPQKPEMFSSDQIQKIAAIFHKEPDLFPDEEVIKVNFPRKDIPITIAGNTLDPFMGITTWIAFQQKSKSDGTVIAMGDIVLLEDEVNSTMSRALDNGINVTALHNHFFYDTPHLYFMHIEGNGTIENLATRLKQIVDTTNQINKHAPFPLIAKTNAISGSTIEKIVGVPGQNHDGMFKIVIGRQTKMHGCTIGKNIGINTWMAFAGTDDNAIVDGDFAVLEDELQSVLNVLRKAGINIVAIHNHMIHENPRIIFVHYWGYGTITHLASVLKKALDVTKKEK